MPALPASQVRTPNTLKASSKACAATFSASWITHLQTHRGFDAAACCLPKGVMRRESCIRAVRHGEIRHLQCQIRFGTVTILLAPVALPAWRKRTAEDMVRLKS